MNDLIVISDKCESCGFQITESANFCSHCGSPATGTTGIARQSDVVATPVHTSDHRPQVIIVPQTQVSVVEQALNNRAVVIALLLCAGPMGLPALWFSAAFSPRTKIALTLAYFLVTAVFPVVAMWYFLDASLRPLLDVFR